MKTFSESIDSSFLQFLDQKSIRLHQITPNLIILSSSGFCLKIYDRLGHGGNSATVNISRHYSEDLYVSDDCNIYWVLDHFNLSMTSSFSEHTPEQYSKNLPLLIDDIVTCIGCLEKVSANSHSWTQFLDSVHTKALKQWST